MYSWHEKSCLLSRAHDDVILNADRGGRVCTPTMVDAEYLVCTINSTSAQVIVSVQVKK